MSVDARRLELAAECDADARDLHQVMDQLRVFADRLANEPGDAAVAAAVALTLDRVYTASEAASLRLVTGLGGQAPSGPDWHARLLRQALLTVDGVRPPIFDPSLRDVLSELLGFRHRLRHAYLMELDASRLAQLAAATVAAAPRLTASFGEFATWLRGPANTQGG